MLKQKLAGLVDGRSLVHMRYGPLNTENPGSLFNWEVELFT